MRVYVAAPYASRDHLRDLFGRVSYNFELTSEWLNDLGPLSAGNVDAGWGHSDDQIQEYATRDFAHVDAADALLLITSSWCLDRFGLTYRQTTSGGRHIETGYALARGKLVVVLGPPENIFHRGVCTVVPGFLQALRLFEEKPTYTEEQRERDNHGFTLRYPHVFGPDGTCEKPWCTFREPNKEKN